MNKRVTGIIQMTVCATLWSIAGIIIKKINASPLVIAGVRSLIAAICSIVYMRAAKIKFSVNKRVLLGSFFTAGTFLLFVGANKLTDAANAIVLQFTEPVFLLIFSAIFLSARLRARDLVVSLVTLLGIALFFADSLSGTKLLGNLVAVGAGISMALMYMIFGDVNNDERMSGMLLGHLLTAAVGITAFIISPDALKGSDIAWMAVLGVFQLGIPYILFCLAVGKCSAFACSLIGAIEPLLNPVWVMLFAGETPGRFALLGGIIVISAVTIWSIYDARHKAVKA